MDFSELSEAASNMLQKLLTFWERKGFKRFAYDIPDIPLDESIRHHPEVVGLLELEEQGWIRLHDVGEDDALSALLDVGTASVSPTPKLLELVGRE